ncbi:PREDICTED: uncharacterized protein LOC109167582 isoform X1 [Ipomoea nil]|uniref:uncharacterized protein LOC109167582 isoform X1 n=1 Tax=Ipomoea nil TaxID=35883 RepID=UPI00090138A6|nr:PREDICTED: uncharacterized protein LOC109167582 isoform X1 [Ipomoea nil]
MSHMIISIVAALLLRPLGAASVVVPTTGCYVLDNSSYLYDFSRWIGRPFEYDGVNTDTVVRFCKDVQSRSQKGYVDFGRYDKFNYFVAGSGNVSFVQEYFNGDLLNCEMTFDKMGRTAQVNIICGNCTNTQCKGGVGCVCSVSYESTCRVVVELAIPCEEPRERVFEGFTVGFLPRTWEIVRNGMTQFGFEKAYKEFSFSTEQTHVDLYATAVASLSNLVQKASVKVYPEQGLKVTLSESTANGVSPTTLSPTILAIDWRCETARDTPYEVEVTIPITNYDPVQFTLSKMCESSESESGDASRGWATFGVISCVFIVSSTLCCCGGFIYKTRVQNQYGRDALPGMTILSTCLESLSGGYHRYRGPEDANGPLVNQVSCPAARGTWTTTGTTYGSI